MPDQKHRRGHFTLNGHHNTPEKRTQTAKYKDYTRIYDCQSQKERDFMTFYDKMLHFMTFYDLLPDFMTNKIFYDMYDT